MASVTKQFTAAGILRLVEQGQIELDQPVGDHLQDFPFAGVTVRHLLNQTSGIPDVYMSLAKQHRKEFGDSLRITDVVDLIRRHPPRAKLPGDEYRYSNTNYVLLAGVIESVSGMSYEDFMREELFEPLGMKHTRVWNRVSAIQEFPERAEDFEAIGSIRVPLPLTWIDGVAGDGAVFCSLQDFLIWDKFWTGNPLVSDRVLAEAQRRQPQRLWIWMVDARPVWSSRNAQRSLAGCGNLHHAGCRIRTVPRRTGQFSEPSTRQDRRQTSIRGFGVSPIQTRATMTKKNRRAIYAKRP